MSIIDPSNEDVKTYFDSYGSFASRLRTWLVAYGIGAPVLFASQSVFSDVFKNKEAVLPVIYAYLIGVGMQIFAAYLYKASMWYIMWGAMNKSFKLTNRYIASNWISEQLWLELLLDLGSIILFAWATAKVLILYAG